MPGFPSCEWASGEMSIRSIRTGAQALQAMEAFSRQRPLCRSAHPAGEQAPLSASLQVCSSGRKASRQTLSTRQAPGTQEKVWFYRGRCQSQDVHVCETGNKHQAQPKLIRGEHLLGAVHTILDRQGIRTPPGKGRPGGEVPPIPCPTPTLDKTLLPLKSQFPYLQNGANNRCLSCRVCGDDKTWVT